jgi:hypothetical protein
MDKKMKYVFELLSMPEGNKIINRASLPFRNLFCRVIFSKNFKIF